MSLLADPSGAPYTPDMTVGVFGLGRFGRFWSSTLSRVFDTVAYDVRPEAIAPEGVRQVGLEELCRVELLYLCVAIRSLPEVLGLLAPQLPPGVTVADACSVKVLPARWMSELLPPGVGILATHPMFGPESAKESLAGLPVMIDPLRALDSTLLADLTGAFEELGLRVVRMSCDEHDRQAAYSQALTHFIGRSLHGVGLPDTEIATSWYRKLHAVARQCVRDSEVLFEDMQTLNPYAAEMRQRVIATLEAMSSSLAGLDAELPSNVQSGDGEDA